MAVDKKLNEVITEMYHGIGMDMVELPPAASGIRASKINTHQLLSLSLRQVHSLVIDIMNSESPAFKVVEERGVLHAQETSIGKPFAFLRGYLDEFNSAFDYSEQVTVFFELCAEFGLSTNMNLMPSAVFDEKRKCSDVYNEMVSRIRERCASKEFRNRVRLRKERSSRAYNKSVKYINNMFAHGDLLVLRMEFRCEELGLVWPSKDGVKSLSSDMTRFVNKLSKRSKPFQNLIGHVSYLGFGLGKRDIYHVIFFFDGSELMDEIALGNEIGHCWELEVAKAAGRRGLYFDCRYGTNKYRAASIGRIGANEAVKRRDLMHGVYYLTKFNEYLKLKTHADSKSFNTGGVRKKVEFSSKTSRKEAALLGI